MKKRRLISILIFSICVVSMSNCQLKKMVKKQDQVTHNAKPTATESRGGKSTIAIKGTFPEKYFAKKATMTITPAIKNYNGEIKQLTPIDFQGEKADGKGQIINYKEGSGFNSVQNIPYDPAFGKSILVLNSSVKKGKKEVKLNEKEIGEVNMSTKRQDINPKLIYKNQPSDGTNYYFSEHNYIPNNLVVKTATIYFDFNSDKLNWELPYNQKEENKQALIELFPFLMDYDSIQSIDIEGWASPEGELRRNQQLSNNRSGVGKKWFEKELESYLQKQSKETKSFMKGLTFNLYDKGEDWDGFINALKNSNIEDKDKIINVIQSQATKIQKEQQIQNMIAIYDEVDQKILPCLRRSYMKISCVENLRTDEEIIRLANISPDSLTKNELLYAASLTNDMEKKKEIYSKAIELHPEDYRGYNDLACIKVTEGKTDEAKKLFENANVLKANNNVVLNNLGIMSYQDKDYGKAEKYFTESQNAGMDQSKNLALVKDTIYTIDYQARPDSEERTSDEKVKKQKGEEDINMAIKINALTLIGAPGLAYELKLSKHFSAQIEAAGTYYPNGFLGTQKPISLIMGFLQARYYPKEVFKGFFVGVNVGYGYYRMARAIIPNYWHENYNGIDHKGWNIMTGLSLGWSFPIKKHWGIEPFVSTGYTYAKYDNYIGNNLSSFEKARNAYVFAYNGGVYFYYKF